MNDPLPHTTNRTTLEGVDLFHENITIVGKEADWEAFPAIYYLFISVSTIGFGDMYLYHRVAETNGPLRILKMLFVFVIVVIYVAFFTRILHKLARRARQRMNEGIRTVFVRGYNENEAGNTL